jgi:hypothetical protein
MAAEGWRAGISLRRNAIEETVERAIETGESSATSRASADYTLRISGS